MHKKLTILIRGPLFFKSPSSTAYIRMFCSASSKNVSPQTTHCHYACGGVAEALAARRVKRSTFWFANALPNHICPLENAERLYFLHRTKAALIHLALCPLQSPSSMAILSWPSKIFGKQRISASQFDIAEST